MANILVVEDNPVQGRLIDMYLRDQYEIKVVPNGESALEEVRRTPYELVLLDIGLPGISGYDVCKTLKDDLSLSDVPVIFLSANTDEEDRLRGFEVGGYDYLNKPVARAELQAKIAALVQFKEERRSLQQSVNYASIAARTAMSSAAEQSLVLQFLTRSFACTTHMALAQAVLETCSEFGLECLIQLRGQNGVLSYSRKGNCSPIEASILTNLSNSGRIVELGKRTSIRHEHCTLIALNMPRDEADLYGRLQTNLTTLVEGANARMHSLDLDAVLERMTEQRRDVINVIGEQLLQINQQAMDLQAFSANTMHAMVERLHEITPLLDLNLSQETMLLDLLHTTEASVDAAKAQGALVEKAMITAMETLQNLTQDIAH